MNESINQSAETLFPGLIKNESYNFIIRTRNSHETEEQACDMLIQSRDTFVPLMAVCSFTIAHHLHSIRQNRMTPSWIRQLSDTSVHPSWLDNIKDSIVGDFTIERVGI